MRELRGFAQGLLKDAAAVRAGLSLIWRHGPTEGCIHRLKQLTRHAYGRAGVDCWRRRILALSAGAAASSAVRRTLAAGEVWVAPSEMMGGDALDTPRAGGGLWRDDDGAKEG